ncbi:amidoligase family protein [Microvirga subterranea]|uniref:Putative amidoligase enzyme n=1 Tax=Microvirga subterranea TaxID=186651 RepID=A0A370HHD3_9HYPH|nr:amidoligase family protein [Microvirga subterranea]RDI56369.1 putative amidoligase enzyme [Microvirga subterranea]
MHDIVRLPDMLRPPVPLRADGSLRQVGIEIEFLGLSARSSADVLARGLGGSIAMEDPHAFRILGTALGDIAVETDLRHVHPGRDSRVGVSLNRHVAAWLGRLLSPFVPRELITAPLPIARLPEVDGIVSLLRTAGARDKGAAFYDSLGLHFNIDPPSLDPATVTAFLKAFLLVEDRLRREVTGGRRHLARVLPPDYPQAYRQCVLAPDYWPDQATLIADYLAANPTRNRGLDLLPLFAYLNEEQVRSALPHEKIGPRPALHYRLPQAHVSDPGWSILPDWERWLFIERLAATPDELHGQGSGGALPMDLRV